MSPCPPTQITIFPATDQYMRDDSSISSLELFHDIQIHFRDSIKQDILLQTHRDCKYTRKCFYYEM